LLYLLLEKDTEGGPPCPVEIDFAFELIFRQYGDQLQAGVNHGCWREWKNQRKYGTFGSPYVRAKYATL